MRHSASHDDWHVSANAGAGAIDTGASTSVAASVADASRAWIR